MLFDFRQEMGLYSVIFRDLSYYIYKNLIFLVIEQNIKILTLSGCFI